MCVCESVYVCTCKPPCSGPRRPWRMCPASPALLEEVVGDTPSGQSRGLSSPTLAPLRLQQFL